MASSSASQDKELWKTISDAELVIEEDAQSSVTSTTSHTLSTQLSPRKSISEFVHSFQLKHKKEKKEPAALLQLHELNEKFIKNNFYIILAVVFVYLLVGVIVYHQWEGWNYLDCFYFLIITVLTIGYGEDVLVFCTRLFRV